MRHCRFRSLPAPCASTVASRWQAAVPGCRLRPRLRVSQTHDASTSCACQACSSPGNEGRPPCKTWRGGDCDVAQCTVPPGLPPPGWASPLSSNVGVFAAHIRRLVEQMVDLHGQLDAVCGVPARGERSWLLGSGTPTCWRPTCAQKTPPAIPEVRDSFLQAMDAQHVWRRTLPGLLPASNPAWQLVAEAAGGGARPPLTPPMPPTPTVAMGAGSCACLCFLQSRECG